MFNAIYKHISEVLLVDRKIDNLTEREQMNLQHRSYYTSKTSIYIEDETTMKQIDDYVKAGMLIC